MADPHHVAELDGFDRFSVHLYRAGLIIAALGLLFASWVHLRAGWTGHQFRFAEWLQPMLWFVITVGAALSVQNMHLYDKRVRWVIGAACWTGAVLLLAAMLIPPDWTIALWVRSAGLGFVFVTLSGFALKEQFCFRIPFLRLVPVVLAASLIPLLAGWHMATGALMGLGGVFFLILAVEKARMPLHFDIGDKSRYQT